MKKYLIFVLSILTIISIVSVSCFATVTTSAAETTSPFLDESISSYTVKLVNPISRYSYGSSDYSKLCNILISMGAINTNNSIGTFSGTYISTEDESTGNIWNDKGFVYTADPVDIRLYSSPNRFYNNINYFEITTSNLTVLSQFESMENVIIIKQYNNYLQGGFHNSLALLSNVVKTFTKNQFIILAIGLSCGTFFVSFAIFKTKSLIKGY